MRLNFLRIRNPSNAKRHFRFVVVVVVVVWSGHGELQMEMERFSKKANYDKSRIVATTLVAFSPAI